MQEHQNVTGFFPPSVHIAALGNLEIQNHLLSGQALLQVVITGGIEYSEVCLDYFFNFIFIIKPSREMVLFYKFNSV